MSGGCLEATKWWSIWDHKRQTQELTLRLYSSIECSEPATEIKNVETGASHPRPTEAESELEQTHLYIQV